MKELGYPEVNLNLGCPSGTVTAKGKGSGFLARLEDLDRFFEEVFSEVTIPVSVKTRMGITDAEEFHRILEVYNKYPITCVTIHARVQKEKYKGKLHLDVFEKALENSKNPVCYNGDLRTVSEIKAFEEQFPQADAVMIGRGAVADPALLRKMRGGSAATREELQAFLHDQYHSYQEFYGQVGTAAQRMREVWFYLIHMFEDADKLNKKLRRFKSPGEYEAIEAAIFQELVLRTDSQGDLT
jgi:tRNA-dihydrouridine synthase